MIYFLDLIWALWSFVYLPNDVNKIERRWRFIEEGVSDERKKQLPYRLIKKAYMRKLMKMLKRKFYKDNFGKEESPAGS